MSERTIELGMQAQDAIERAILSAFADENGGTLTIAETARRINICEYNRGTTDRTLRKLKTDGLVERPVEGGPYELSDEGRRKCRQLFG